MFNIFTAYSEGRRAGNAGDDPSACPYPLYLFFRHLLWKEGWSDGIAERIERTTTDYERKKRK